MTDKLKPRECPFCGCADNPAPAEGERDAWEASAKARAGMNREKYCGSCMSDISARAYYRLAMMLREKGLDYESCGIENLVVQIISERDSLRAQLAEAREDNERLREELRHATRPFVPHEAELTRLRAVEEAAKAWRAWHADPGVDSSDCYFIDMLDAILRGAGPGKEPK